MAHFMRFPSSPALNVLRLESEERVDLALWGGGAGGEVLTIAATDPRVVALGPASPAGPDVRRFSIGAQRVGSCRLEATNRQGHVWAVTTISVVGRGAAMEVARGVDAVQRVAALLPTALPLSTTDQFGTQVRIAPGTVWGGDRMFISDIGGRVAYVVGDRLYSQATGSFVRDTYLIALGEGARRAAWLIPIAQAEMAFLMALVGTLAGIIGTIAAITVFLAKIGTFYTSHKREVDRAAPHLGTVLSGLSTLTVRCPRLAWLLFKGLGGQALQSAGRGVSAPDIAYFLGKLLGGLGKAPELTLLGLLKVTAAALAVSVAVRTPGAAAHGAQDQARALTERLLREGISLSEQEALTVATENCLRDPEMRRKLEEIATSAEVAQPIVEALSRALQIEQAP